MIKRFTEGKIYYAFEYHDDNIIDFEILQAKCEDAENLYFEFLDSKKGFGDVRYHSLTSANIWCFRTIKECKRGFIKHVFER